MGRIIGLIGGTCLLIAVLRLTNLQHEDQTRLGGVDAATAQTQLTPRQAYRQGKELYLRGRYDEALGLLEAAAGSTHGLSPSDLRQAEEYLSRTRLKLAQQAVGVRGQSPDSDPFATDETVAAPVADATRTRIERFMAMAQDALRRGDKQEAAKWANQANTLAKSAGVKFGPKEASPATFLAQLGVQPTTAKTTPAAKPAAGGLPDWAGESNTVTTAAARGDNSGVELVAGVESLETTTPATSRSTPEQDQARSLVAAARADIKAGRLEDARRKALQADKLEATFDLFEDRPELLLADIDRRAGTLTVAKASPATPTAKSTTAAAPASDPFATAPVANAQPKKAPAAATADAKRQEAKRLLELAREDLKNGNLEGAQAKAQQADDLKVAYKLFDDRPEVVLNEIAANLAAANMAQASPATEPATKAAGAGDVKQQAKQLLTQSRKAMSEGRLEEARKLAEDADKLKAAYVLFDDRPELVLEEIDRIAARSPAPKTGFPANSAEPQQANGADEKAAVAARQQAVQLMKEARQLMQAGRLDEARAKAAAADKLDVAYGVLEERPDLILAEIGRAEFGHIASRAPAASETPSGIQTADAKFGSLNEAPADFSPAAAEVAPAGLSAQQWYNQGMTELGRGNRAGAHQAFLHAHQTGQRLDPVRQQRLQNYLRELAPRNGSKIQLANNQVADGDLNATGPALAEEPAALDMAEQQQTVKFDRLRTETLNAVFRAERLRAKDPEQALQIIEQAMAAVEGAELSPEASAQLLKALQKTSSSLQAEISRQQPNILQANHNKEVMSKIEITTETKIFVEQEFAKLVEEFNNLMEQRRFAEAEVVAKKAKELDPKNPVAETLFWKSRIARRADGNDKLRLDKEESFFEQLNDVEMAAIVRVGDDHPVDFPKDWKDLSDKRKSKYRADTRARTEEDIRIEQSLQKRISLHEEGVPLAEVIRKIAAVADISIVFDTLGLQEEGIESSTPVTIDVDGIMVKSALNLMLEPHQLGYVIGDEVLKITSRMRQQGDLIVATYPVADLVIPIPMHASQPMSPFGPLATNPMGGGQMNVPANGMGGQAFGQVDPLAGFGGMNGTDRLAGPAQTTDFDSLTDLITTTISPDSWLEVGGSGSVRHYETTLSLVVRQTQRVHDEITDLLEQLRRLQDLQVTIEVRFVTVADRFFERIGIDFDFNIQDTVGGPNVDNNNIPLLPFGSVRVPQAGFTGQQAGQQGQQQGGQQQQQGQQAQQAQAGNRFFTPDPTRELTNRDNYPNNGTVVGLSAPNQFSSGLDIPFQQGSFEIGVPDFGGFNPQAGAQFGLAVLSDIEAFFFIQAAQGDERSNLLFAPKVTLFNGQIATVQSNVQRPFVISLTPTVGVFSTGFQPQIAVVPDGVFLLVQAVISADRRFVRLSVSPNFTNITDVFTFSFVGGQGGQQGQGGGGQLGQQGQGGQGGFGGGQGGGFGGGGQFGIGGGMGTTHMVMNSLFGQQNQQGGGGFGGGGQQGQGGQQNQGGNLANTTVTVQQPVVEVVNVSTTVSVPDGGTVLLGGVKRLREGRNMAGVPILNKIPYVSRLFKNTGVGRETESLMLMVTPRIIIQEEEEELLGIPTE